MKRRDTGTIAAIGTEGNAVHIFRGDNYGDCSVFLRNNGRAARSVGR